MSDMLQDRPPRIPMGKIWRAEIASNPDDLSDRVSIIIPDISKGLRFDGLRWQARDAVSLPRTGDSCLVVFDNDNEPWVVVWWPF